jgi:hypothetical protein
LGRVIVYHGPTLCRDDDWDDVTNCDGDCDDRNPECRLNCADADADSFCADFDCDETNAHCTIDCTDDDSDSYCADTDCDEANPRCAESCVDFDGDGWCQGVDCDDYDGGCNSDCADADADDFCADMDCDDSNPGCGLDCADLDLDGFCLPLDCSVDNGTLWLIPGEVHDVRFGEDRATLSWVEPVELGGSPELVAYDTIRSEDRSDFVNAGTCLETNDDSDLIAVDPDVPQAGEVYYYLVRAENDCGEGPLGYRRDSVAQYSWLIPRPPAISCGEP